MKTPMLQTSQGVLNNFFKLASVLVLLVLLVAGCNCSEDCAVTDSKKQEPVTSVTHGPVKVSYLDMMSSRGTGVDGKEQAGFTISFEVADVRGKAIGENFSFVAPMEVTDNLGNKYYGASFSTVDSDAKGKLLPSGAYLLETFFAPSLDPKAKYLATIDFKLRQHPAEIDDTVISNIKPGASGHVAGAEGVVLEAVNYQEQTKELIVRLKQKTVGKQTISTESYVLFENNRIASDNMEGSQLPDMKGKETVGVENSYKFTYKDINLQEKPFDFVIKWQEPSKEEISFLLKNIPLTQNK